jgi:DNA-binding CsgD family transcriptional regulator
MGRTRQTELELTDRQRQVIRLIARGHTNTEIAERLGISLAGAKWHVSELLSKFGADTREELAERWEAESSTAFRIRHWLKGLWGLPLSSPDWPGCRWGGGDGGSRRCGGHREFG